MQSHLILTNVNGSHYLILTNVNGSTYHVTDFPGGSNGKASAYSAEDPGSIPGLGRSSGEGNDNPFQYSCLENPMEGGAW